MSSDGINSQILARLPLGVILFNQDGRIVSWNHWLVTKTSLAESDMLNKALVEVFPESVSPRFMWAFDMVLKHGMSQVLSQVLNHYLIPIKVLGMEAYGLPYMQQHVELMPIEENGERFVMVCIIDVTMNVVKASHAIESADNLVYPEDVDQATQLYNRRYLWQWLRQQFILAGRLSFSISAIMIELNTDDYVLGQIDSRIKKIVELIMVPLRRSDCVMRFDDKHLIALLPSCEYKHGIAVKDKLKSILEAEESLPICYFGVATWSALNPCTSEELIKTLLQQLRKTKAEVKNNNYSNACAKE